MALCWEISLIDMVKISFVQDGMQTLGSQIPIYHGITGADYDISAKIEEPLYVTYNLYEDDHELCAHWEGHTDVYTSKEESFFTFFLRDNPKTLILEIFNQSHILLAKKNILISPSWT